MRMPRSAGILAKNRQTAFSAGRSGHAYTNVVQGVVVSIENGFEPPGVISDVF